jgi:hypothetical protein
MRLLLTILAATTLMAAAQEPSWEPLRFEAEAYSTPKDGWLSNRSAPGKWNLWSTDVGGEKRWSGGVVLQAAAVKADRATPEEGVVPLHTVIPDIPPALYNVEVKVARTVAVSLDGKTWQRFNGGFLQRGVKLDGTFELWVDDRYAYDPPGPCYYDCVILHRVPALEQGLYNPGFEAVTATGKPVGWSFHSPGKSSATVAKSDRPGKGNCLRVIDPEPRNLYTGGEAWSLRNHASLAVTPGQQYVLRAWVKSTKESPLTICVEGWLDGNRVERYVGTAHTGGAHDWRELTTAFTVPEGVDALALNLRGRKGCELYLDDFSLMSGTLPRPPGTPVRGWAKTRVTETLDRGLVALPCPQGTYLSWRLLKTDPANAAFDVYRQVEGARRERLNSLPITRTTDFLDNTPPAGEPTTYRVRLRGGKASKTALPGGRARELAYLSIPFSDDFQASKVGVGDLDGDGRYDVVVKHPGHNVWCWNQSGPGRWERSPDTYKLDAYTTDGKRLWRRDLGWAIEQGLWYSPYLVHDLDGDGRAEVIVKTGEGDPRNKEGRVVSGAEWVSVWDGRTGKEIARAPWPGREGFGSYDTLCRHFLAVAYLDSKTPCLLVQRGNYGRVIVDAYQFHKGQLKKLWRYDNESIGSKYWGQGAHTLQVGDLDNDGRDEIVLGGVALDDDGSPMWTVGKGHPDYVFLGDVDPARPGWEVFLGHEHRQKTGGNLLVDARTGKTIWGLAVPTNHVGIDGMCSDIDPTSPGLESQAVDVNKEKKPGHCWLWSADGRIMRESDRSIGGARSAYWDADLQRELVRSIIVPFDGAPLPGRLPGTPIMIADLFGDWREEIVVSLRGELRIYSTTIPATDRRVCLMQDPLYRNGAALNSMGYPQVPMTSTCLAAVSPGLNLTASRDEAGAASCRVVVSAPLDRPVTGTLSLRANRGTLVPQTTEIKIKPGECQAIQARLDGVAPGRERITLSARLVGKGVQLTGEATIGDRRQVLSKALTEAENLSAQTGGEIHVRDAKEKPGVRGGKCFSHWFNAGHRLEWVLKAPAGRYRLLWRYCCAADATRSLAINGQAHPAQTFRASGGFGANAEDWDNTIARDAQGNDLIIKTDGKPLTIRMVPDGKDAGVNLDYVTLLPMP